VITYAGAIMVLFVFVIMILNLGPLSVNQERSWLSPKIWIGPTALSTILFGELLYAFVWVAPEQANLRAYSIGPERVGATLLGPYVIGVELASMLLLAALIGAYHLGYRALSEQEK
jgi:NADH-quinone oxidoreductase subunit J